MSKFAVVALTTLMTLSLVTNAQEQFSKYRKVEAYELRPGVLMMPRYTADNRVCEIGLERLLYSPRLIRLNSSLSREEIFELLDELVPADERGNPSKGPTENLITRSGQSMTRRIEFENVSIQIYGATLPSNHKNETTVNEVVATVKWKQRVCR